MPFITPGLAVEAGLRHTELHILDGGGRAQLILELEESAKHRLIAALTNPEPVVTITIDAEEVVEAPPEQPEVLAITPLELVESPSTYWAALTKAEIVAQVQERFGVELDIHDKKDDLITQAIVFGGVGTWTTTS